MYIEPHARRIQAVIGGRIVIDTERALMMHRHGEPLSYAFAVGEIGDLPGHAHQVLTAVAFDVAGTEVFVVLGDRLDDVT